MDASLPEPWLRGALPDVHPLVMPVLFSFAQVREDLRQFTAQLTEEQVWRPIGNAPPLGFHLKHIAGSIGRLTSYLMGAPLTDAQLHLLHNEAQPDARLAGLLSDIEQALHEAEQRLRELDPASLYEARTVGRKQLPTTVAGLLVHLAEHTQRHLGQAITTAAMLRFL